MNREQLSEEVVAEIERINTIKNNPLLTFEEKTSLNMAVNFLKIIIERFHVNNEKFNPEGTKRK